MTVTPAPNDLDAQWLAIKSTIKNCRECAKETDRLMGSTIDQIRKYRGLKKQSLAGGVVDFGFVAELFLELELLMKESE